MVGCGQDRGIVLRIPSMALAEVRAVHPDAGRCSPPCSNILGWFTLS